MVTFDIKICFSEISHCSTMDIHLTAGFSSEIVGGHIMGVPAVGAAILRAGNGSRMFKFDLDRLSISLCVVANGREASVI